MKKLAAAVSLAVAALGANMVNASPILTIVNTSTAQQEHTGDPGGSLYQATQADPGVGLPWVSPNGNTWPNGPGISPDPSFPPNSGTSGWQGSYLTLNEAATVTFQYVGGGNASQSNLFQVFTANTWTTLFGNNGGAADVPTPCGASGGSLVCTPGLNEIAVSFGLGDLLSSLYLPFRYITGQTNPTTVTNDGTSNPTTSLGTTVGPGFFLGLDPYLATGPHQNAGQAVYAGLSDLPRAGDLDHDYQDMGVRISVVPEPGSLFLLGAGVLGLAGVRRRKG